MSAASFARVAEFDAPGAEVIDDEVAARFREDGLLVLRNVLVGDELAVLQAETAALVDEAVAGRHDDPDFRYSTTEDRDERVPFRVEYVVDKLESTKALLGHPFLLRTVEALQGPEFVPTWDSMVFKMAGAGAAIPWHRDGGLYEDSVALLGDGRVFNVDIYLDHAGFDSCLWGLPGSNRWSQERAGIEIGRRNRDGAVDVSGDAVPITMGPGDVLLHNVLVVHGSQATTGALRRVLYYEFRPVDIELAHGPHTEAYVLAKRAVLAAAIDRRRTGKRSADEPPTWRYPHEAYWRTTAEVAR